jgi:hypothetical protein
MAIHLMLRGRICWLDLRLGCYPGAALNDESRRSMTPRFRKWSVDKTHLIADAIFALVREGLRDALPCDVAIIYSFWLV